MFWYDTAANILKMRSEADDAWINVAYVDQSANAWRVLDNTQVVNTSGTTIGYLGSHFYSTWRAGVNTEDRLVSPAKVKAAIQALVPNVLNASGTAPLYACRAWVNFNGSGTVAIRASGNVSSITDNGVGDYTINFATAMQDANYAMVQGSANVSGSISDRPVIAGFNIDAAPTSSAARIYVKDGANSARDSTRVTLSFFR
jgi:hypothetical protein